MVSDPLTSIRSLARVGPAACSRRPVVTNALAWAEAPVACAAAVMVAIPSMVAKLCALLPPIAVNQIAPELAQVVNCAQLTVALATDVPGPAISPLNHVGSAWAMLEIEIASVPTLA